MKAVFLQVLIAWIYGHIFEYIAHRYFLHDHKKFKFAFRNHFAWHHKISRKNSMYDENYESVFSSKFEVGSLILLSIVHIPVAFFYPYAYLTLACSLFLYYFIHRKAHTDIAWGRKWLPWHYDHHMGKNQHMNWGVRLPLIDLIMRTRVKFENYHEEKQINQTATP